MENNSISNNDDNIDSSISSSDDSDYNPFLKNDIYEEDLLFSLLQLLNNVIGDIKIFFINSSICKKVKR